MLGTRCKSVWRWYMDTITNSLSLSIVQFFYLKSAFRRLHSAFTWGRRRNQISETLVKNKTMDMSKKSIILYVGKFEIKHWDMFESVRVRSKAKGDWKYYIMRTFTSCTTHLISSVIQPKRKWAGHIPCYQVLKNIFSLRSQLGSTGSYHNSVDLLCTSTLFKSSDNNLQVLWRWSRWQQFFRNVYNV
jgi:hypothetical protein